MLRRPLGETSQSPPNRRRGSLRIDESASISIRPRTTCRLLSQRWRTQSLSRRLVSLRLVVPIGSRRRYRGPKLKLLIGTGCFERNPFQGSQLMCIPGVLLIFFPNRSNIEDVARDAGSVDIEEEVLNKLQMELEQLCPLDVLVYQPLYEMIQAIKAATDKESEVPHLSLDVLWKLPM